MDNKLYIKKFIRNDGQTLSFDGEEIYLDEKNTLLVRPDPATTAVEYTEADGGEMIRQRNAIYQQEVNGLIIPKTSDYWTLTQKLSQFFRVNYTYKLVYKKVDGSMFAVNGAWISSGLQIVPVPYETYSEWNIQFSIGETGWTEYAENEQGEEIYSNTVSLPLISLAAGGEIWEYETAETKTGEGTNIEFDDTVNGGNIDLEKISGDTMQQTYSGKNLCDIGTTTFTRVKYYALPKPLPVGTYTFSATINSQDTTNTTCLIRFMSSQSGSDSSLNHQLTHDGTRQSFYTTTTATTEGIYLYSSTGASTSIGLDATFTDIQIEAGNTLTDYEPYVGGVPSPNPDYPQTVHTVTGEQEITITGRNVWNPTPYQASHFISATGVESSNPSVDTWGNIYAPAGTTFTMQATFGTSGKCRIHAFSIDGVWLEQIAEPSCTANTQMTVTFTTPNQPCLLRWCCYKNPSSPQLEYGSTASIYQQYQSQSYTIDLDSTELCKIGDYQDYIYKSGDDWYVHKAIGNIVLDGSENWSALSGVAYRTYYVDNLITATRTNNTAFYLSNNFTAISNDQRYIDQTFFINSNNRILISYNDIADGPAFKTWLGSHNTIIYYVLATPTDTKITDADLIADLNALDQATLYSGVTYITVSGDLAGPLKLTAQNPPVAGEKWDNVGTMWEAGAGGVQTVSIDSSQVVYPVWKVEGPCVNPKLQNNTTDTVAEFDGTVAAGQVLTVDFAAGTAYLDTALVTRFVYGSVSLVPGENTVGFNSDGGTTSASTIQWNNIVN